MSLASIQKEIFQLNARERAMLIDVLWESLDEARISEILALESEDFETVARYADELKQVAVEALAEESILVQ